MPRVVHFEIHAADPQRAIKFYSELLGWQFSSWGGPQEYWVIRTGEPGTLGIDGGMIARRGNAPAGMVAVVAYVCTVDTPDVDGYSARAVALGGQIVVPKMPIPGVGWLVYCKDTEGNIFGMMQNDPAAK
ncbi:MAG: VOC family protein [Gemmataceae bacterium]|nr:VOC family protein [Gemmataceae bacterium]